MIRVFDQQWIHCTYFSAEVINAFPTWVTLILWKPLVLYCLHKSYGKHSFYTLLPWIASFWSSTVPGFVDRSFLWFDLSPLDAVKLWSPCKLHLSLTEIEKAFRLFWTNKTMFLRYAEMFPLINHGKFLRLQGPDFVLGIGLALSLSGSYLDFSNTARVHSQ